MQNDLGAFLKLNQCYTTVLCQSKPDFCWAECNHLVKLMKVFVCIFFLSYAYKSFTRTPGRHRIKLLYRCFTCTLVIWTHISKWADYWLIQVQFDILWFSCWELHKVDKWSSCVLCVTFWKLLLISHISFWIHVLKSRVCYFCLCHLSLLKLDVTIRVWEGGGYQLMLTLANWLG